jgi:hypothetical protein
MEDAMQTVCAASGAVSLARVSEQLLVAVEQHM